MSSALKNYYKQEKTQDEVSASAATSTNTTNNDSDNSPGWWTFLSTGPCVNTQCGTPHGLTATDELGTILCPLGRWRSLSVEEGNNSFKGTQPADAGMEMCSQRSNSGALPCQQFNSGNPKIFRGLDPIIIQFFSSGVLKKGIVRAGNYHGFTKNRVLNTGVLGMGY